MIRLKISTADRLMSLYIRERDGWTCQRCFAKYPPPTTSLQNSHFFGRTMKSVRWDPDNCDSLCHGCHRYWEKEDREGYRTFKVRQLGEKRFDLLTLRAHQPQRVDEKLVAIWCREQLKKMGANPGRGPALFIPKDGGNAE